MKKVLLALAILAIFALPALAQYQGSIDPDHSYWTYQWYNGFENCDAGALSATNQTGQPFTYSGQNGWVSPVLYTWTTVPTYTNYGGTVVDDPTKAIAGSMYFQNGPGGSSSIGFASARSMADLSRRYDHQAYREGFAEFWMYDPRGTGTGAETDTRAWLYSLAYNPTTATTPPSSYTWGAMFSDSRAGGKNYWVFHMGDSFFAADGSGTTAAGGTGGGLVLTSVPGQARQRTMGWHQVQLYWDFTWTQGRLEMYVDDMTTPCFTVDLGSQNSRWANIRYVSGIFLGSTQATVRTPGRIDDISFYARDPVLDPGPYPGPEPSSFMALGAGLIGLLGMIRRRKK